MEKMDRFRTEQKFLEDDAKTGRPLEVIMENIVAIVEELVLIFDLVFVE